MLCPECGRANEESSRYCFCGNDLSVPAIPAPVGVGGWLLFFCVQLTILGPLLTLLNVALEFKTSLYRSDLDTPLGAMHAFHALARFALMGVGAWTGAVLWLRRPGAVRLARAFLILFAACHLAFIGLPWLFRLPEEMLPGQLRTLGLGLSVIPSTIFWSLYFAWSRRVKATYSPAPAVASAEPVATAEE